MSRVLIPSKDKTLILTFGTFALLVVGLAVVGAFRSYSPVPFWDMWNGTLEFFMRVSDGDNAVWWEQHNEHRIVLSRLLFWADLKWFAGVSWFLIAVNYFLVGASALLFYRVLRAAAATEKPEAGEFFLGLFITAWLFLWMQSENLTWGFQSQFILAQLLPLCALYWLHKSVVEIHAGRHFLVACGFGLASVGTMANGILALPLMMFYALLTRQGLVRVGVLLSLSVVTLFFYFHDYNAPVGHGSLSQALKENPSGLLQYVLLYVGSPFYVLFGKGVLGKLIGLLSGLILIGSSARFAIKSLRQPREVTLTLALLFFILYIGGTALGTAGGRLIFGIDQALSSRYTTPALMAWAALLVLYSPAVLAAVKAMDRRYLSPFAVLAFLMITLQLHALKLDDGMLFQRKIAALALELHVKDQVQVNNVYPDVRHALAVAGKASAQNLSIFGAYPFRDAREQLGVSVQQPTLPTCQGSLDAVEAIDGEARFVRISGWIFNPAGKTTPQAIRFLDSHGKVVGYALTGQARPDVADAIDKKALQAGYGGYLLTDQMGAVLSLQGESPSCQMQTNVPVLPFAITTEKPSVSRTTLGSANVLPGNQWLGSDFARSVIDGMQVYGSLINSDADVGSISLRIKRGDRIFYRSGPTGGRQILEVSGSARLPGKLPVSPEWALLDFSSMLLPDGDLIVKFLDNGTDWGEWSAIAVRKSSN